VGDDQKQPPKSGQRADRPEKASRLGVCETSQPSAPGQQGVMPGRDMLLLGVRFGLVGVPHSSSPRHADAANVALDTYNFPSIISYCLPSSGSGQGQRMFNAVRCSGG
jgi:hypothetical protein